MRLRYFVVPLLPVLVAHCSGDARDARGEGSSERSPGRVLQSDVEMQKVDVPEGPVDEVTIAKLDETPPPRAAAPHPRLIFSEAELPALRAAGSVPGSARAKAFARLRSDMTEYVVPTVTNAIEAQGKFGRDIAAATALQWLLSGEEYFRDKAKAIIAAQLKGAPAYGATVVFDAQDYYTQRSFILNGLALAYDWLYSALTVEERTALRNAIVALGTELYVHAHTAWWATLVPTSNFTGNNGVAFGMAGLAIWEEEPSKAPAWVARATQLLRTYGQAGFDSAGASYEGVLYGNYGLRNPAYFVHALERAGGPNPLREGNLSHQLEWVAYELLPGSGALNPMNDARYDELEEAYLLWASSHGVNTNLARWITKEYDKQPGDDPSNLEAVLFIQEAPGGYSPEQELPLAKFFPGRGLVHARSGFSDKNDLAVAFEARQTNFGQGVHQQADVGNFTLYAEGARFAIDSGYCNYVDAILAGNTNAVRSCETKGHNAVEADGRSQDFLGRGKMRTFATTASVGAPGALDVAVSDARSAYLLAGPAKADRFFLHVRAGDGLPDYVVVADAFRQDGLFTHDYASYLHTDKTNTVSTSGEGTTVRATIRAANGASLEGTWVGPGGLSIGVDTFVADYEGVGAHPRAIVSSKAVEHDAIGVLSPVAISETAPRTTAVAATGGIAAQVAFDGGARDLALERTSGSVVDSQGVRVSGAFGWVRIRAAGASERYALVEGTELVRDGAVLAKTTGAAGTVIAGAGAVAASGAGVTGFRAYVGATQPSRVTLNGAAVTTRYCSGTVVYPAGANCP